jgi:hypothetical protein
MYTLAIRRHEGLNLYAVAFKFPGMELGLIPSWTVDEQGDTRMIPNTRRKLSRVRG